MANRSDFESFFPVLATKYFDINAKNRVGTSILDIYKANLEKLSSSNPKLKLNIDEKIIQFKELVADNYINSLYSAESTESANTDSVQTNQTQPIQTNQTNPTDPAQTLIPLAIKKNCSDYSSSNPNKKKTLCWYSVMDTLSKPSETDLDKLNKDYQNITFGDYQFAHYNLYNARDADIYLYYLILMKKYSTLSVPFNDPSFDKKKISSNSEIKINSKSHEYMDNFGYFNTLLNNTTKHYMLYPLNIYWMDENNYLIPYNLVDCIKNTSINKDLFICRINIIGKILHANVLLVDRLNKRIIRFEPQGGINKDNINILDNKIKQTFHSDPDFADYVYFKPSDYLPISGFQSLSQETDTNHTRKGDINGFCVAWCLWWIELYMQNMINSKISNNQFAKMSEKVIKKLINNGYLITEYIRNYANHMHKKLVELLVSKSFSYSNLYYERYTDSELNDLYAYINKSLGNL